MVVQDLESFWGSCTGCQHVGAVCVRWPTADHARGMLVGDKFGQMKPHNDIVGRTSIASIAYIPASPVPYSCTHTHTSGVQTSAALLLPACSEALEVVPKEGLHAAAMMQHLHRMPGLSGARLPCICGCREAWERSEASAHGGRTCGERVGLVSMFRTVRDRPPVGRTATVVWTHQCYCCDAPAACPIRG